MGEVKIRGRFAMVGIWFALAWGVVAAQPAVQVDTSQVQGPRQLEEQTRSAAIRGYLKAWQTMSDAFVQNRVDILNAEFVGAARDKLADTINEQTKLGFQTRYQDRAHHIRFVFYSPEGLSIELIDQVDYDVQVIDHGKPISTVPVSARYIVVLTPSEIQWRVRIMQADSEPIVRRELKKAPVSKLTNEQRKRTIPEQGV
jgi:hypothetical protein